MNLTQFQHLNVLATSLQDALNHWDTYCPRHVNVYVHDQRWSDGSCGFGGMSVTSTTKSPTVVITKGHKGRVYHSGRFAYQVEHFNNLFKEHLSNHKLLGQLEYDNQYEKNS